MRIQAATDLLMATVDNAAASVANPEGDSSNGETFAQLLQGLPAESASAAATAITVTAEANLATPVASVATAAIATLNSAVAETTVVAVAAEAAISPAVSELDLAATTTPTIDDALTTEFPLTTTDATPITAGQADASSARMLAALRREFVPTPVRTSAVELPAKAAKATTPPSKVADGEHVTTHINADSKASGTKARATTATVGNTKPAASATTNADSNSVEVVALTPASVDDDTNAAAVTSDNQGAATDQQTDKPRTTHTVSVSEVAADAADAASPLAEVTQTQMTAAAARLTTATTSPELRTELPLCVVSGDTRSNTPITAPKAPAAKTTGNRGTVLPAGGNRLPPTHRAPAGSELPSTTFATLLDTGVVRGAEYTMPTYDTAAPRATLLPDSSVQSVALPPTANPSLASQPLSTDNGTLQLPPVFTSTLVMGTAGWSEETAQHIHWMQDDDMQSADIQLHPAELGRLDISIDFKDGQANVHLVAGSAEARELLEKSMPSLRELLAQSGMSLGNSNVAADHQGREARAQRFNAPLFQLTDTSVNELPQGRPALFRSHGGSNRIDYYV